jgi:hypothetical protein
VVLPRYRDLIVAQVFSCQLVHLHHAQTWSLSTMAVRFSTPRKRPTKRAGVATCSTYFHNLNR